MEKSILSIFATYIGNDEVLARIYIGQWFKNDTERLEKLFEMYTKMTAADKAKPVKKVARASSVI